MFSVLKALIAITTVTLLTSVSAVSQTFMTNDAFRDAMLQKFETMLGENACLFKLQNGGIRAGFSADSCDFQVYTKTAYFRYLGAPDQLDAILSEEVARVQAVMQQKATDDNFRERLVVQLRPKSFFSGLKNPVVATRFAGDMYAVLMLDSPQTLEAVSVKQLTEQNLTEADAFQLGAANTRARMGQVVQDEFGDVSRLYSENGLISGQVWLPETCSGASVSTAYFLYDYNGVLRVTGDDIIGLSKLISYARNMVGNGTALSHTIVRCDSGVWKQLWPVTQAGLEANSSKGG